MNRDKTQLVPTSPPLRHVRACLGNAARGKTLGATFIVTSLLVAAGCAGSQPPPTQLMADVQSANRSATELGAQDNPQAKLHLKLAEEQLNQAKVALEEDDNERAEALLMRAKADGELAVALTREGVARGSAGAPETATPEPSTTTPTGATP